MCALFSDAVEPASAVSNGVPVLWRRVNCKSHELHTFSTFIYYFDMGSVVSARRLLSSKSLD